jgi:cephalosporin-C deacetylase-like acetyl esterase
MADATPPPPPETARVLDYWSIYSDAPNAFYKSFADEALARLAERKAAVARLQTPADWTHYQREVRKTLRDLAGPFPEKTPLNARTTGLVRKDGFRVEKIIYESQPGFHVTAALYVPEPLTGRAPAVLYCSGHSDASFRSPAYQAVCLNLVKKGFVVLAFDPVGQGERLQFFNPRTNLSVFGRGSSSTEHTRSGTQCFLTGSSLARYMIWDGIRSLDYLLARPEVDPARIGITGRSGGGTQSAYLAAIDDRIRAAAPENYLTTFERLFQSRGPQDPEQNFHRGLARGFDQPDLVIAHAPKPMLIVATTRDIFSIDGNQVLRAEAQRAYAAFGDVEALALAVDDAEHVSTKKNREAIYAFFQRHLNQPGDGADEGLPLLSADELRVTETGQVSTTFDAESVFTLNRREAVALAQQLDERRRDLPRHLAAVKTDAARLAGYTPPTGAQAVVNSGRIPRDGYIVEKYVLPVDDRYGIPVVTMTPTSPVRRVILYLHPQGKSAQAAPGGEMEWLVRQGCAVIAPDILGAGELGPGIMNESGERPPRLWYGYVQLGKSMIGRQLADIMRVARFAQSRYGVAPHELSGIARGNAGPLLLHAAAIEGVGRSLALIESLISYRAVAMTRDFSGSLAPTLVPAALTAYDLPDLAATAAPRDLLLVAPIDARRAAADAATIAEDTALVTRAYRERGAAEKLTVVREAQDAAVRAALAAWLR